MAWLRVRLREKWLGLDWRQNAKNGVSEFLSANHLMGSFGVGWAGCVPTGWEAVDTAFIKENWQRYWSILTLSRVKAWNWFELELQNLCPWKCSKLDWPSPWGTWPDFGVSFALRSWSRAWSDVSASVIIWFCEILPMLVYFQRRGMGPLSAVCFWFNRWINKIK